MRRLELRRAPRLLRASSSSSSTAASPQLAAARSAVRAEVKQRTEHLTETVLAPLNARLNGPLERSPFSEGIPLPFVLLLGNHSSGKSSFINHVLGRPVQATGVAPTDDGFTVICPGAADVDRDGASFIGDPAMGFAPLRSFGPAFISHFKLKVRGDLALEQIMLVDSPGMIDSPAKLQSAAEVAAAEAAAATAATAALGSPPRLRPAGATTPSTQERGYDFLGVTRWLAEHADVILLFFDPDKPGTTGETLQCLTSSLRGTEHKLHIVMNKVDQFEHIHDFARAYGSLCWNLAKVIPRKDLPPIYTMFLPLPPPAAAATAATAAAAAAAAPPPPSRVPGSRTGKATPLSSALAELEATRGEVLAQVHAAPERRVDNLITRAHDSAALLRIHAVVADEARAQYASLRLRCVGVTAALSLPLPGAVLGLLHLDVAATAAGGVGAAGLLVAALAAARSHVLLGEAREQLTSDAGLDACFERVHALAVAERDEFTLALWWRARPQLQTALRTIGLEQIERLPKADVDALDELVHVEVPALRRLAAPVEASAAAAAVRGG